MEILGKRFYRTKTAWGYSKQEEQHMLQCSVFFFLSVLEYVCIQFKIVLTIILRNKVLGFWNMQVNINRLDRHNQRWEVFLYWFYPENVAL